MQRAALYCFYAGIILPQLMQNRRVAGLLTNGLATIGGLLALLVIDFLYNTNRLWLPYKFVANTLISAQILGFIMLRPGDKSVTWLGARPLVWLGDISYSFYVYSMSLQLLIAAGLLSQLHAPPSNGLATLLVLAIAVGTIGAALVMASISHRWVELPTIVIGQKWSQATPQPVPDLPRPRMS